ILDQPLEATVAALQREGVPMEQMTGVTASVATVWNSMGDELTELGKCNLELIDEGSRGKFTNYILTCTPYDSDSKNRLLAKYEAKWGKPSIDGSAHHYPGDHLRITAEESGPSLELKVAHGP